MATFGQTGTGSSDNGVGQSFGNASLRAGQFSTTEHGLVTSLSAIVHQTGTAGTIELAIYNSTGTTLLGNTAKITLNTSAGTQTYTANLITPISVLASTNYYLAIWGDTGTNIGNAIKANTTGGTQLSQTQSGYDTWVDISGFSSNSNLISIYATYTPDPSLSVSDSSVVSDLDTTAPLLVQVNITDSTTVSDTSTVALLVPFSINLNEVSVVTDTKIITIPILPTTLQVVLDGISNTNGFVSGIKIIS